MGKVYCKVKKGLAMGLCGAALCFLASCAAAPDSVERDGVRVAAGGTSDNRTGQASGDSKGSDGVVGRDTEGTGGAERASGGGKGSGGVVGKDTEGAGGAGQVSGDGNVSGEAAREGSEGLIAGDSGGGNGAEGNGAEGQQSLVPEKSPEERNAEILAAAAGMRIERSVKRADGKELSIDAEVMVEGVERVSRYQYILQPVTEEIRKDLFQSAFPTRASEMEHDERNDVWTLGDTSGGKYWLYQISFANGGATIPGEEIIVLEYRYYDLYPFENNRLKSVSDCKASVSSEEAVQACGQIVTAVSGGEEYAVDYIHAYGNSNRRPYYKIVFKRMLDGMPVTIYNNLSFLYDNDGLAKVWGSLFSVEETGLEAPILTAEEAVDALENQAVYLDFEEEERLAVSEIALEYLALMPSSGGLEIVPVWRFWLGEDADERNFLREKILAIHAVTGELIWEERGNTF